MAKTKSLKNISTNRSTSSRAAAARQEPDSVFVLKLVLYLILGSQWFRLTKGDLTIPLPVGLLAGLWLARLERLSLDRKIGYAILLLSMFIGFWLPIGLELAL